MSVYKGQTYNLPLIAPGLGYSRNSLVIPSTIMENLRNCNIHELGLGKRGGTAIHDTISGTPRITGLHDYQLRTGERFLIRSTNNGKIYKDNTNTIATGLSTRYPESLNEGGFATVTKWSFTGDFKQTGATLEYEHSTGSGTATQTIANMAIALRPGALYELTYDVTNADDNIIITIPTSVALTATTLDTTSVDSSLTVPFYVVDNPTGFILSGTSNQVGNVVLDNLSLKEYGGAAWRPKFNTYKEKLVYTNGVDLPQTWNGSDTATKPFGGTIADGVFFIEVCNIYFDTNPTAGDTITLHGHVMTFASPAPGADDILIGASASDTVDNAVTKLNAHANANIAKCTWSNQSGPNLQGLRDTETANDPYAVTASITGATEVFGVFKVVTITLGANPADGDTITINSVDFTFKTAVTTPATQILIGGSLAATLDNIISSLQDSTTGGSNVDIADATYTENGSDTLTITASDSTNGIAYRVGTNISGVKSTVTGVHIVSYISVTEAGFDFITENFEESQQIRVFDSVSNDGTYTVAGNTPASSTIRYLSYGTSITQESNTNDVSITYGLPTDWTEGDMPKYSMIYNVGNQRGIMFYGVRTYPYSVYIIPDDTFDASDSNVVKFIIETEDSHGIVGAREFGNRQLVFGKKSVWYLDLSDTSTANWTYGKLPIDSGSISDRSIVEVDNDIHVMSSDGNIYSINRIQEYGDYEAASLSRSTASRVFGIDRWIKDNIDFTYSEFFHARYDYELDAVFWWVSSTGTGVTSTALVYFIKFDRWVIHNNVNSNSGYTALCSINYTDDGGIRKILTGDSSGSTWKLNQTARNDNSNSYWAGLKLSPLLMPEGNILEIRQFDKLFLVQEVNAGVTMSFEGFVDGTSVSTDTKDADTKVTYTDKIFGGQRGREVAVQIYNETAGDDFFLMGLVFYYELKGMQPE